MLVAGQVLPGAHWEIIRRDAWIHGPGVLVSLLTCIPAPGPVDLGGRVVGSRAVLCP